METDKKTYVGIDVSSTDLVVGMTPSGEVWQVSNDAVGIAALKNYAHPRRRPSQQKATVRFETGSGEQAQVDWGVFSHIRRGRTQAPYVGIRDGTGLVSCDLRGVRASCG